MNQRMDEEGRKRGMEKCSEKEWDEIFETEKRKKKQWMNERGN